MSIPRPWRHNNNVAFEGEGYEYPHAQSFSIGIEACDSSQLLDFEDLSTYGFDIADAEVDLSHHYLVVKHSPSDDWEYLDLLEEMTR